MKRKDLVGKRFGNILVVSGEKKHKNGRYMCRCSCSCGNVVWKINSNIVSGHTKSCGCLGKENLNNLKTMNFKHGKRNTKTYQTWARIKVRCNNKKSRPYKWYGGRGIKVCDRWLNSFENFYEDMGDKPRGLTLDRIDNDGNYTPNNCRWATWEVQANNRRGNVVLEHNGEIMTITQWSKRLNISAHILRNRRSRGKDVFLGL